MTASEQSTADRRTMEAEQASETATETSTSAAHELARDLHRDAAVWQLRVENAARAELHQVTAKVHGQLAARIEEAGEDLADSDG